MLGQVSAGTRQAGEEDGASAKGVWRQRHGENAVRWGKKKEIALAAANAFFSLDKQHPKAQ